MLLPTQPNSRSVALGLAGLGCILALVVMRLAPPAAQGVGAPASVFSAGRAAADLEALLGDGAPHPLGSPANAAVRDRLLARLNQLGYETEVQTAFVCSRGGVCAEVRNVLARRPGREVGPFVLLMSHYDSVGAGPGAADDGSGTAVLLETARILAAEAPRRNPVLFLMTDGEEAGLLGAQAFAEGHRLASQVAVVVNVEARGTSGASLLFETSGRGNAWLVRQGAASLPRPVASSVFAAIYDRLPNDTDLSIFKRRSLPGLNFAMIGEPRHYHTPLDDLRHLDRRSLQQQGDNLLALARRLADAESIPASAGRLVFFDLGGLVLIRWSETLQPWMAGLTLVLLLVLAWQGRAEARPTRFLLASVAFLLACLAAAGCALALTHLWGHGSPGPRSWIAAGWAPVLAAWCCGLIGPALSGLIFRRWLTPTALWLGSWVVWALLAVTTARLLPGAAYLFLAPSLVAAVCGLLSKRLGDRMGGDLAALLPVFVSALLAFPLAWILYDAMGLPLTPAIAAIVALAVGPLLPLLPPATPPLRLLLAPLLGVVAGGAATALLAPDSADRPQRLTLAYVEEAGRTEARLMAIPESGRLPEAMRQVYTFGEQRERALPWSRSASALSAGTPAVGLAPPELVVLSDAEFRGQRHLRLALRSPRGATAAALAFQGALPGVAAATVTGGAFPAVSVLARLQSAQPLLQFPTLSAEGLVLDLVLAPSQPLEVIVADRSSGLPPAAARLVATRPPATVTSQDGDVTLVLRRIRL